MIIAGAGGHAKDLVMGLPGPHSDLVFFDDLSDNISSLFLEDFTVIRSVNELKIHFKNDPYFILGVGKPSARKALYEKCIKAGGELKGIRSESSQIGTIDVRIDDGVDIMPFSFISNSVTIGKGTLINTRANVHHDTTIGTFCEISPGSNLLGGVSIGNYCFVGAGVIILPNVTIGNSCVIGAGAVVTTDITDNQRVVGVPAKPI